MLNGIPFFGAAKNSIPFSRLKPITKKDPESKLSESLKIIIFNRRSKNYSMIVATLPDPTVRPPSRYFNPVFYSMYIKLLITLIFS